MSTQTALKLVSDAPESINEVAARYKSVKAQIEALEASLVADKLVLEQAAMENNLTLEVEDFKITLSECKRENFSIKDARVILGDDVVAPFIKVSSYTQLRVVKK